MKVKSRVIDKYMELCPISTYKCNSFRDIEDKIIRVVNLGCLHEIEVGKQYIVYFHNCFVVEGGNVIDMFKEPELYWEVSEDEKDRFDTEYQKILV